MVWLGVDLKMITFILNGLIEFHIPTYTNFFKSIWRFTYRRSALQFVLRSKLMFKLLRILHRKYF